MEQYVWKSLGRADLCDEDEEEDEEEEEGAEEGDDDDDNKQGQRERCRQLY